MWFCFPTINFAGIAVASRNKLDTKCLFIGAGIFAENFDVLCWKLLYETVYVCSNEEYTLFQYRCLQWTSSWEWIQYLIIQVTSLQTYHYEQVGTAAIGLCYFHAVSSSFGFLLCGVLVRDCFVYTIVFLNIMYKVVSQTNVGLTSY